MIHQRNIVDEQPKEIILIKKKPSILGDQIATIRDYHE